MWKKNIVIEYEIELLTGLHIGGSGQGLKIGGTDNPVIMTVMGYGEKTIEVPYIPGSSIKGRMKSLLLSAYGTKTENVLTFKDYPELDSLFGRPAQSTKDSAKQIQRTRMIIRDALPDEPTIRMALDSGGFTEIKGENSIDPVTGMANPRFIDRIKPGMKFRFQIILQIMESDNEGLLMRYIEEGTRLIEDTYLGGQGTRGYGKVKIRMLSRNERGINEYRKLGEELVTEK
jgi:CRISPR-associated protein Csm3